MKLFTVVPVTLALFTLSGCTTLTTLKNNLLPPQYDGKDAEKYENLADVDDVKFIPIPVYDIKEYPSAQVIVNPKDGKEYAAFDKDGFIRLMELKAQHKHNTEQLNEANKLLDLHIQERNEIYHIGLDMQEKANLQAEKVILRDKELSAEKRKNFIQRWIERGIFGALIYFAAT